MSTRGGIVRLKNLTEGRVQFSGVYHHWDSYPTGLGKTLFHLYNDFFKKNHEEMMKYFIDEHPAGWSTINGGNFNLPPGFQEKVDYDSPYGPQCYCHGGRREKGFELTEENAAGMGCEWVYAFDKNAVMYILCSYCDPKSEFSGQKMIGGFGMGDPKAIWKSVAKVVLGGDEPDWTKIYAEAEKAA